MNTLRTTATGLLIAWSIATGQAGTPAAALAAPPMQQPDPTPFEEEDLAPDSLYEDQTLATVRLFEEAEELFRSASQPDAIPLLDQVIQEIERRIDQGRADEVEREILLQALFYRSEAYFNLGDDRATEDSLTALLTTRPDYRPDATEVSPKLLRRLDEARRRLIGELKLALTPPDAELMIDGREVETKGGVVALQAGSRNVRISRAGYRSQDLTFEITAGGETSLEVALERTSAVAKIFSRPAGAEVLLDDEPAGVTSEPESPEEEEGAAPPFAELTVDGLTVGKHVLEVRKPGYRPRRFELSIAELGDYAFEPIELEPMAGTLILTAVPSGARVLVGGRPPPAEDPSKPLRVSLPPGDHRVTVTRGTAGWFETEVAVEDRQTIELEVRLRPGLSFLGVLGGDDLTARDLHAKLTDLLSQLEAWTLLDRSAEGVATVAQAGLDTGRLRRLAADGLLPEDLPPWKALQQQADLSLPGSAYLLAVLSDDLFAKAADLWFLPAGPAPALPVRHQVSLERPDALSKILAFLEPKVAFERATLGVEVIDSLAADHPVVTFVAPGGPAAAAGIGVGDYLVAIEGESLSRAADLERELANREPGSRIELQVERSRVSRSLAAKLSASPSVVSPSDPRLLYPLAWAALAWQVDSAPKEIPSWVIRFNEAAVLLRGGAWAEAIRALREIRAPERPGLGQAAVEYWLGVALLAADPAAYLEAAREAFSRALEHPDPRLYDDLGAVIGPRARGRLANISTR